MGIPSFFRTIIKNYPETHFWDEDLVVDHFFMDFNAMVYETLKLLSKEINTSELTAIQFEGKLLPRIIEHMEHVICDVIKPQKSVYIAIDGPPPRAKMIQQRFRRYKAVSEFYFKRSLEKTHNVEIHQNKWTSSSISPGTIFMSKLSKTIVKAIREGRFNRHKKDLTITFSDACVPGEGEHKLLPNIRKLKDTTDSIIIYSPDADLIVLALMTHQKKIYILREPKDSEIELSLYKDKEFLYLSIDKCREGFFNDLQNTYNINGDDENDMPVSNVICDDFLWDYSFLTFLCGNDFVVPSPFLKVKEGGMDVLMEIYKDLRAENNQHLVVRGPSNLRIINKSFFKELILELRDLEEDKLQNLQRKRDRVRRGNRSARKIAMEKDMEPWKIDFARFQHEEYYSPHHPQHERYNKVFNRINYYEKDLKWVDKYNEFFFVDDNDEIPITDVCKEYYRSLSFCLQYYQTGSPSWTWFYKYRAAPTFHDMVNFLNNYEEPEDLTESCDLNSSEETDLISPEVIELLEELEHFEIEKPYTPFEQLMLILPKQTMFLLPRSISNIDESIEQYYPGSFKLDIVQGTKFIYSEPILPEINIPLIQDRISKAKPNFSKLENERNTIRLKPYVHNPKN
jgi:5'-3' exonuclease